MSSNFDTARNIPEGLPAATAITVRPGRIASLAAVKQGARIGRYLPLAKVCKSVIGYGSILAGRFGLVCAPVLFCSCRPSALMRDEGIRSTRTRHRATASLRAFANPKPEVTPPRTTMPLPGLPAPELPELAGPPQVSGPLLEFPAAELDAGA